MFSLELWVAGNSLGDWDKKTGGEVDSEEVKYYPGGIYEPISLGGRINPGNITLQRLLDRNDDWESGGADPDKGTPVGGGPGQGTVSRLLAAVGKHEAKVTMRPLDLNGDFYGLRRLVWTGIVKRVLIPDVDSESTSAALIEVEISVSRRPEFLDNLGGKPVQGP